MIETLRNAWKIEDLRKKLIYTMLILLVVRIGSAIPVPFIDPSYLQGLVSQGGNLLGYLDMLTGGAFSNATLFALSISPYITASIVIQLLTVAIPALERMQREGGEEGKKKLQSITRYATVGIAFLQALGYYFILRNGFNGQSMLTQDSIWVALVIMVSWVAGSSFLMWLGEQCNEFGVGNGISMILFAGIISRVPSMISQIYSQIVAGNLFWPWAIVIAVGILLLVILIVFVSDAERRIPVQYAKRVVGRKMYGGQSSFMPIKVNMSGVLPVIFASTFLAIPGTIGGFLNLNPVEHPKLTFFFSMFSYNSVLYAVLYFLLIIGFNYFYIAIQYNPIEMANNLRKNNGAIPGIRPGKPTSDFITKVISKITLVGALMLAAIAILPILITAVTGMNVALGGTSVIILVGVALDTVRSLESQMMMRHYKGFLE